VSLSQDPVGGTPLEPADDAANLVARVEGRLDDMARRFDRSDRLELLAAVLFFTSVSGKLRGRGLRAVMLLMASYIFVIVLGLMLSLPQSVAI